MDAMPLAPGTLAEEKFELELLRFEIHPAHLVPTYQFHMVDRKSREILGNIRLSIGSTPHLELYAGHIGYGVLLELVDITMRHVQSGCWCRSHAGWESIRSGSPVILKTWLPEERWSLPEQSLSRRSMCRTSASSIATGIRESAGTVSPQRT